MTYELWETASGNVLGGYDTEADALEAVRDTLASHGRDAVLTWLLMREDRRGNSKALAHGEALIARAQRLTPA